jgi:hypothetical protein
MVLKAPLLADLVETPVGKEMDPVQEVDLLVALVQQLARDVQAEPALLVEVLEELPELVSQVDLADLAAVVAVNGVVRDQLVAVEDIQVVPQH